MPVSGLDARAGLLGSSRFRIKDSLERVDADVCVRNFYCALPRQFGSCIYKKYFPYVVSLGVRSFEAYVGFRRSEYLKRGLCWTPQP